MFFLQRKVGGVHVRSYANHVTHIYLASVRRKRVSERRRGEERMARVAELLLLVSCSLLLPARGQYSPNWDSLDARPLPAWYDQAKLGIFIHWGVFSVPSYGGGGKGASEWFWWDWKGAKAPWAVEFMEKNYQETFTYPDFAPQFKAEMYNPEDWGRFIAGSGAKLVPLLF